MSEELNLCFNHRQEPNLSHFDKCNCDYCKLEAEVERLEAQIHRMQKMMQTNGRIDIQTQSR